MSEFSLAELKQIMQESAGVADVADLSEFERTTLSDLGCDSLAIIETATCIERNYGLKLPEDELFDIPTPGAFVAFVNDQLREKSNV